MLWQPLWNNSRWKPEGLCGNLPSQERSTARPVRRGYDREMWIFSSPNRQILEKYIAVGENA